MVFPPSAFGMIGEDQICVLVGRNEEHQLFDYKGPMTWIESGRDAIELVKDVIALANSGGGHLVIGVAEKPGGGFDFVGLSDSEAGSWESTRVGAKVRAFADPPVTLSVRIAQCHDRRFAVITVAGFQRVPHICKKVFETKEWGRILNAPAIYVRTVACESRPVQSAVELSEIIERAVRIRQDQMLEAMRSVMIGASTSPKVEDRTFFDRQIAESLQETPASVPAPPFDGMYTDTVFPARFDEDRFSRSQLKDALKAASVSYEGWPFLYLDGADEYITTLSAGFRLQYVASTLEAPGSPSDRYFYWRIRQSGLLVVRSLIWEDSVLAPKGERRVNKSSIVGHVAQSMDALIRLYTQLDVSDEEVTWSFVFSGTGNRTLADPPQLMPFPGKVPATTEPKVSYRRTQSI